MVKSIKHCQLPLTVTPSAIMENIFDFPYSISTKLILVSQLSFQATLRNKYFSFVGLVLLLSHLGKYKDRKSQTPKAARVISSKIIIKPVKQLDVLADVQYSSNTIDRWKTAKSELLEKSKDISIITISLPKDKHERLK